MKSTANSLIFTIWKNEIKNNESRNSIALFVTFHDSVSENHFSYSWHSWKEIKRPPFGLP